MAPAAFTMRALSTICFSVSTEQGPAITGTSSLPNTTPGAIVTSVFSGRHSRETCLYGFETWITLATPGSSTMSESSTRPSLPTSPTAVRCAPGIGAGGIPHRADGVAHAFDVGLGGGMRHYNEHRSGPRGWDKAFALEI